MVQIGIGMEIWLYKFHDITASGDQAQKLDVIGIVDEYISCIFTRSWTGVGEWQIVMPNDSNKTQLFREADFIKIHDKACGFIDQEETIVNNDNNTTTFVGKELKGITSLRVLDPSSFDGTDVYDYSGGLKRRFISENISNASQDRKIPSVINTFWFVAGKKIHYHPVYSNLAETIEDISKTVDTGWYADIQPVSATISEASKNMLVRPEEERLTSKSVNVEYGYSISDIGDTVEWKEDEDGARSGFISVIPNRQLYFYGIHTSDAIEIKQVLAYTSKNESSFVDVLGVEVVEDPNTAYELSFQVPSNVWYIRVVFDKTDNDVMLEYAPKTSYDPPHDATYETFDRIVFYPSIEGLDCTKDGTQTQLEGADWPLIISDNSDTLYSSTFSRTKYLPNVAYVAGQGQGTDREIAIVNEQQKTGIERFETLIDARDVSDTTALPQRGVEYLSQFGTNISYTCEASNALLSRYPYTPFDWGDNYDQFDDSIEIGNYGTYIDEINNIEVDFQITSITEVYEENSFRLELQFGYDANNLSDNLSILASRTQSLLNADPNSIDGAGEAWLKYWLGIKTGSAPYITLLPDPASGETVSNEAKIMANDSGEFTLSLTDTNSATRYLNLATSSVESELVNSLKIGSIINGTATEYTILNSGNLSTFMPSNISCTSLTASGTVKGKNLTATNNITATNTITCANISVTNQVSCKLAHIEDTMYPMFELKPTQDSTTKVQRVEGSYVGEVSLQAWADSTGENRTVLSVYDPAYHSALDGRIAMRQCVDGTWTTYNMLHSGNVSTYVTKYATPLSPSSVSSSITWNTDYVNTDSGKTSYVCYKLGKIRYFRFKLVLKQALTATTVIGTVASGNRPNTTIYGTLNQLTGTTNDVRTISFATGGNVSMYNNTKATTYYGTVVFFTS